MEQAAILKSGNVVKLTGLINPKYTIYGFLNSFETVINGVTKKFKETLVTDFREEDQVGQVSKDVVGGFYEEKFFLEYLIDKNKLYQLKEHRYTFKPATSGDEINVKKLKVTSPYIDFCKIETYKWTYQPNVPIVDYGTWQIKMPNGVVPDPIEGVNVQLSDTAMQFYNHKIGLFVTPLSDTNDKQLKAFLFAKIGILINSIEKMFNLIELDTNTDFGQYINSQKSEWSTQPIFANPTVVVLEDYLRNLTNFYNGFYTNQILIKKAPNKEKLYWLARCLSAEALSTVPTNDKIELLKNISGFSQYLTESNNGEQLALKIIESFTFNSVTAAERNDLLYALMQIQIYQVPNAYKQTKTFDTKQTLFEILYSKIDDDRISRYTIGPLEYVVGFLKTTHNRKKFILLLYKIWKSSTYNPKYADPSYTLPANVFGIYPESYYMKLITENGSSSSLTAYYNPETSPALLVYNASSSSSTDQYMRTTGVDYILGDLEGKKIKIHQKQTTYTIENSSKENNFHTNTYTSLYGTYELYQPISIIGFKPDLDLVETFKDPETGVNLNDPFPNIPVFFLYYLQDYSELKKLDFSIVLVAEIALNLTGAGALNDLKYFGYLSKARSVWTGTATASETVLFWKAVEGVNTTVQFTADNLSAINNYSNNTTTDPDVKEFTNKVSVLFDVLTIVSLGTDPIMKRKLINAASDVIEQEAKLITLGKSHGLSPDTMNAIKSICDIEDLINLMQLKLNNLPSYANDNILSQFNTFTQKEKYDFFTYFYNLKEEAKWTEMNFRHSRIVNGQAEFYTWVDVWKNEIQFLKNNRTYEFLESFHAVRNDAKLLTHIHNGDFEIKLRRGNSVIGEPKISGSHNLNRMRNRPITELDPLAPGELYWVDPPPKLSKPNDILNSYQQGKIQRNMSDLYDPHTNQKYVNGSRSSIARKNGENVYFPKSYSAVRINEEVSYALSQINKSAPNKIEINSIGQYSFTYYSKATDGHIIEIVYLSNNSSPLLGTMQTIYPRNF